LVIISDNVGTIDTLQEMKPGHILPQSSGNSGKDIYVKVISENKEYSGSSTMLLT